MGDALRITVIATGFDLHLPAHEDLEEAIRSHSGRRRQSQMVAAGAIGPGTGPVNRKDMAQANTTRQGGLFSSTQLHAPRVQQVQAPAPAPSRPVTPPTVNNAAQTSSWSRAEVAADPSEIPAFLRRRDENGFFR